MVYENSYSTFSHCFQDSVVAVWLRIVEIAGCTYRKSVNSINVKLRQTCVNPYNELNVTIDFKAKCASEALLLPLRRRSVRFPTGKSACLNVFITSFLTFMYIHYTSMVT